MKYDDLFLQRRMKIAHSTPNTRTTVHRLDIERGTLKRRVAVVHTMLQASVQLSPGDVQQLYNTKLENSKCAF